MPALKIRLALPCPAEMTCMTPLPSPAGTVMTNGDKGIAHRILTQVAHSTLSALPSVLDAAYGRSQLELTSFLWIVAGVERL